MTLEQRTNLERLAIVTQRFASRNVRMARGLEIGFRRLGPDSGIKSADIDFALPAVGK